MTTDPNSSPSTNRIQTYDLLLKVEGRPQEAFVQHAMTIGRASSNTMVVEGAAVEHIHARIFRATDGMFYIKGESSTAKILDADGTPHEWLQLREGLRFRIGEAVFSCVRHVASKPSEGVVVTDNPWLVQCPVCYGSLVDYPRDRRQCPHCGKAVAFLDGAAAGFAGWLPLLVGPYKIRAFVGQGGMGVVLRGIHGRTDASAAVKLLRLGDDQAMVQRFLQEAETIRNLAHPNVVTLQDHGQDNRMVWLAMDWVDGVTISRVIAGYQQNRALAPLPEIADIAIQTARGLEYLHGHGIVHRDLKPQNLIRANDNLVKILDFGLARKPGNDQMLTMLTQTGMVAGTAGYMSPEQSAGESLGPPSDIFSLGIMLYEMLTGRRPMGFAGPVTDFRPDCPPGWQSLVTACLSHRPEARPLARAITLGLQAMQDDPSWDGFAPTPASAPAPAPAPPAESNAAVGSDSPTGLHIRADEDDAPIRETAAEPADELPEADEPEAPETVEILAARPERRSAAKGGTKRSAGKKMPRLPGTILAGIAALAVLGVGAGLAVHFMAAPSQSKVDRLLEEGKTREARDVLRELADNQDDTRAMARLGELYYKEGDYRRAAPYLEKAADEEDVLGLSLFGEMIVTDKHPTRSLREGIPYLSRAAAMNDARAQYFLGILQLNGDMVPDGSPEKGLALLERSAKGGEAEAQLFLGRHYLEGDDDVPRDVPKAIPYLEAASAQGSAAADHLLGCIYAYGDGVKPDYAKAAKYVLAAQDKKYAPARQPLAYMKFFGKGLARDINAAVGLAAALLKDNPNDMMGSYIMGLDQIHGYTVSKNPVLGVGLMYKAAFQGNKFALFDVGRFLFMGEEVPQDLETAFALFEKAEERGSWEARPFLARYYYSGLPPVEKDHDRAFRYLEGVNLESDTEAQAMQGILVFERQENEAETEKALADINRAARQGSNLALAYLGRLHVTGVGVPKDYDKAISYLEAPARSLPEAMYWLGRALYGKGDHQAALERFRDAARRNVPGGRLYLGKMYFLGQAVTKDYAQAALNLYGAGAEADAEAQGMLAKINYFGLAGKRDYFAARMHLDKVPPNDDDLKLIEADLKYFGHGGMPVDREYARRQLAALADGGNPFAASILGKIFYEGIGVEKDYAEARQLFESAAAEGMPEALYRLGRMYHEGLGVGRDDALAFDYLEQAVDKDNMEAKALLGKMYFEGDGVATNRLEGVDLLSQASRFGILEAQLYLGEAFVNGRGIAKDVNLAAAQVKDAAEAGDARARVIYGQALMDTGFAPKPDPALAIEFLTGPAADGDAVAQRLLGEIYYHGLVASQQDEALAGKYFIMAAAKGDIESSRYLAEMYDTGKGVSRDRVKAAEYLERLADEGDVPAMNRLGELYLRGDGVPRNEKKAFDYFRRMAETGKPEALCRLGRMYYDGIGVERDVKEAIRLFSEAERKGSLEAAVPLGEMYFEGEHLPQDYRRAARLLTIGEKFATPRSHAMLGWMHFHGLGTEQSNALALKHLEAGVKAKEPLAAAALASIYLDGDIVVEDYAKARVYAEMAVPTGLPVVDQVLGRIYGEGLGVRRNARKGADHLARAAEAGDVKAQYHLGKLYMDAHSGVGNNELAYKYLKMASEQGHWEAANLLPVVARKM